MTFISFRIRLAVLFFLLTAPLFSFAQEEYLPYPGVIHVHSSVSEGGVYSPARLAVLAREKGIKILVFSDSYLRHWEYGLPVFSNIFKIAREEKSVVTYGIKRYLEELKEVKKEFPDMLILEGVEVTPFYWWSGSPFKEDICLNDANRDLLVTGFKDHGDYFYLPVFGNRYFLPRPKDIPALSLMLGLILFGTFIFKKKNKRAFGLILNALALLLFLIFFPFSASRHNPYHGDKGFSPHQDFIDYVQKNDGMVFWSLPDVPEEESGKRFLKIKFCTIDYTDSLSKSFGYTGFGVNMLSATNNNPIFAGGEWDRVLTAYCRGKRKEPAWVIGEADYRAGGEIDSVQNIFFLTEPTYDSVYEALRKGRIYIRYYSKGNTEISLAGFRIGDSENENKTAFMGDTIVVKGNPRLHIRGNYAFNQPNDLKLEVIRNGKVVRDFSFGDEGVFDLDFQDDSPGLTPGKSYYRLNFIAGGRVILATNPIFTEMQNG